MAGQLRRPHTSPLGGDTEGTLKVSIFLHRLRKNLGVRLSFSQRWRHRPGLDLAIGGMITALFLVFVGGNGCGDDKKKKKVQTSPEPINEPGKPASPPTNWDGQADWPLSSFGIVDESL